MVFSKSVFNMAKTPREKGMAVVARAWARLPGGEQTVAGKVGGQGLDAPERDRLDAQGPGSSHIRGEIVDEDAGFGTEAKLSEGILIHRPVGFKQPFPEGLDRFCEDLPQDGEHG
jgi:hypothetical protein